MVHTSGHANRSDLKKMYKILNPRAVIPVHGDKRFVREHQRFAHALGIEQVETARNGDVFMYLGGRLSWLESVPADILAVDRRHVIKLNSQVVKNRRRIAYNCSVFISVVFDRKWNLKDLQISSIDIMDEVEFKELAETIKSQVEEQYAKELERFGGKEQAISDYIRGQIRRKIFAATDIRPVTFFHMYRIGGHALGEVEQPDAEESSVVILADN